jgi:hypothetical protein
MVIEAIDRGLPVLLAGVIVALAGLETSVDVDQLALRQVQASG